jgi:hypothetical protein
MGLFARARMRACPMADKWLGKSSVEACFWQIASVVMGSVQSSGLGLVTRGRIAPIKATRP